MKLFRNNIFVFLSFSIFLSYNIFSDANESYPCCFPDWIEGCVPGHPQRKVWVCANCAMPNMSRPGQDNWKDNCGKDKSCDENGCNCFSGCL